MRSNRAAKNELPAKKLKSAGTIMDDFHIRLFSPKPFPSFAGIGKAGFDYIMDAFQTMY